MKKYIFFANNRKLLAFNGWKLISTLINREDIIVTFNHCLPKNMLFPLLHKDQKIYHFSRHSFNREVPYSGLHIIDKIQERFDKLFLWPHPSAIGNPENSQKANKYIEEKTHLDITKISHMTGNHDHPITRATRQFLKERYNNNSNLSTGLMGYCYIRQIKKEEDQIILIGFDHTMNLEKHNQLGEIEYFRLEVEQNRCIMIEL